MLSIIVAYTKKGRVIGNGGKIPWNLPSERKRFKEICKNKPVIMGRKTFEEIGHGLSYCTIIIISRTLKKAPEGCMLSDSLEKGIELCKKKLPINADSSEIKENEILIAGGGEIYRQVLPYTSKIYATEIESEYYGDVIFPLPEENENLYGKWKKTEETVKKEKDIFYEYVTYEKIKE